MSVSEAIARRQSIRTFGEGDVSEEKINSIISEALRTQSEFNFQPWRVIVIRDRENLSRLSGLAFNQQQIAKGQRGPCFVRRHGVMERRSACYYW